MFGPPQGRPSLGSVIGFGCTSLVGGAMTAKSRAGLTADEPAGSAGVEGDDAGKRVRS
jgi:hypothetical protein